MTTTNATTDTNDKPLDNDPASANNSKHHTSEYLEERYWNDPDVNSPYNADNCSFYPGQAGYAADGQPIVHLSQVQNEPIK